jgi:putative transposase
MARSLAAWRHDETIFFLSEASTHPLQRTMKDLERAYTNLFQKHADFPRFKNKSEGDSFRYSDHKQFKIDQTNNRVFLLKLGWIHHWNSHAIEHSENIAVSRLGKHWFVSIQVGGKNEIFQRKTLQDPRVHPPTFSLQKIFELKGQGGHCLLMSHDAGLISRTADG